MDTQVQKLNPAQDAKRKTLRLLGWVLLIAGLVFIVFGAIRMFEPVWSNKGGFVRTDMPFEHQFEGLSSRHHGVARSAFGGFAIVAAGTFMAAAGKVMLKFGYMGTIARYVAAEAAPVAADTINYMGNRTQQGVHEHIRSRVKRLARRLVSFGAPAPNSIGPAASSGHLPQMRRTQCLRRTFLQSVRRGHRSLMKKKVPDPFFL
jgi:hypothetical protein